MIFFGLFGGRGCAHEVDPALFLFTRTAFLVSIENEGRWFGNTWFLEGREKVQLVVK